MDFDCDSIRPFGNGAAKIRDEEYQWGMFVTDNEDIRILCVKFPDERILETYYDPAHEEFRHALNRILPQQ